MNEMMEFPDTFDEFANEYGFIDTKEYYTNGSNLISVFRVKKWLEHIEQNHSNDLISRTQALQELDKIENKDCWYRLTDVMKMLNRLPSIQSEQKTGITIPDDATNGSMLCYLYPDLKYSIQNGRVTTTIGVAASFDEEWWNAPYKR